MLQVSLVKNLHYRYQPKNMRVRLSLWMMKWCATILGVRLSSTMWTFLGLTLWDAIWQQVS